MAKVTGIQKLILDAQKKYDQAVEVEDYITANVQKGFLNGMHQFVSSVDSLNNLESAMKQDLKIAVNSEQWGQASYCKAWLNGWSMASTIHELKQLDK